MSNIRDFIDFGSFTTTDIVAAVKDSKNLYDPREFPIFVANVGYIKGNADNVSEIWNEVDLNFFTYVGYAGVSVDLVAATDNGMWKTVMDVTGNGRLFGAAGPYNLASVSATHGIRITVDGVIYTFETTAMPGADVGRFVFNGTPGSTPQVSSTTAVTHKDGYYNQSQAAKGGYPYAPRAHFISPHVALSAVANYLKFNTACKVEVKCSNIDDATNAAYGKAFAIYDLLQGAVT